MVIQQEVQSAKRKRWLGGSLTRALVLAVTCATTALAGADACGWETKTAMPTAREGASAGVIDGKLFIVGGQAATGYVNSVQAYDPSDNSWTTMPNAPLEFYRAGSAVINNKMYVVHFGALYVYDPSLPLAQQWQTKEPPPYPHLFSGAAVGVIGGKLYVAGGSPGDTETYSSTRCLEYDPVTDQWTVKASMTTARESPASAVFNNKLYVFGGYEQMSIGGGMVSGTNGPNQTSPNDGFHVGTCEVYDPGTDTWSPIANLPVIATVPQYRLFATAGVLGTRIYVVGGENSGTVTVSSCLEYTPATDTWTQQASMAQSRRAPMSAVINNRLYVVGGYNHWDTPQTFYSINEELKAECVPVALSSFDLE